MDILSLLSGTIVPLIGIFVNKEWNKAKKRNKINKFRKSITIDDHINDIIKEIRAKYGFNRVSIIDYHNGTQSLSGFSFKYTTMSYENTDIYTKDIITEFKNIPCSIVSNMLNELEHSQKGYVYNNIRESNEQTTITHKMFGVDTVYNFRLSNSLINGCLSCMHTSDPTNTYILSEEDITDIKSLCQKIYLIRTNS